LPPPTIETVRRRKNGTRITIVTPSFNQGAFLEETIRSVLHQDINDLEYIVIDGGSTDGSVDLIEKYQAWISYWVSEPDGGQADALNKGFAKATGDILAFINSDDVYQTGVLRYVLGEYVRTREPEAFYVAFPVEDFGSTEPKVWLQNSSTEMLYWITRRGWFHQPGLFWSKALWELAGGEFDNSLHYAFDRKFFMELGARGIWPKEMRGIVAARFRVHSGSKTKTEHSNEDAENRFFAEFQKLSDEFERRLPTLESAKLKVMRASWAMSKSLADASNESSRMGRIIRFLWVVPAHPGVLRTRFFWGALKNLVLGS